MMQTWNLGQGDPLSLEIASDARLAHPDYTNDHIWEVHLAGGEPPSLSVETTFGLRARQVRLFPRFFENGQWISNPAEFVKPARLTRFFSNYLAVQCSPFPAIDVAMDYWVPESHALAGRVQITNRGEQERQVDFEWIAQLIPAGKGEAMSAWQQVVSPVLKGQAEDLWPVLFMTGGPTAGSGSFASLMLQSSLKPGESRCITWALAALKDAVASFELARQITSRSWEAEIARIERVNVRDGIEINTGQPEWDSVFALSQKAARTLLMGSEGSLPNPSFVQARRPDFGYSPRGDGTDHPHLWSGQTPLAAWYLSTQALPADLMLRQELLENFLSSASEDGKIDFKPGLAGQRARFQAQPLLCQLALSCSELGSSMAWLEKVYPALVGFIQTWFSPLHDRDGDGLPEWDNLQQLEFEDHPVFSRAEHCGAGLDITTTLDPALFTLLYMDCQALLQIARLLINDQDIEWLEEKVSRVKAAVQECWDEEAGTFLILDRQTHRSALGKELAAFFGSGKAELIGEAALPARLLIYLKAATENTRSPRISIRGTWQGQETIEEITARAVFWVHNQAWVTSQNAYTSLEQVDVHGLDPRDEVFIRTVDMRRDSLTSFLPLLAGLCTPEQARRMVETHLSMPERYCLSFGMPASPSYEEGSRSGIRVSLPWNVLIINGLIQNGFIAEAASLFSRLMDGILAGLKSENRFRGHFSADTAQSGGDAGILEGLAPLGLFLKLAGITIISPWKVLITESGPSVPPVTVKYQGMTIEHTAEGTRVAFPDGQQVQVAPHGTHLISLSET